MQNAKDSFRNRLLDLILKVNPGGMIINEKAISNFGRRMDIIWPSRSVDITQRKNLLNRPI